MSRAGKPWLRLEMSRQDAEIFLSVQPVGAFIIRTSSHRGNFALSVKYPQGSKNVIHNVVVLANLMPSGASYQLQESQFSFKSLDELVKHYSNKMTDPKTLSEFLRSEYSQGGEKSAHTPKLQREHVGQRVTVEGYGVGGTLMFVGDHHKSGKKKAGVRLDKPVGMNNGVVSGHKYFRCDENHGILVVPKKITLADPKAANNQISQRRSVRASSMKASPRGRLLSNGSTASSSSVGNRRNSVGSTGSRRSSIGSTGSAGDTNPNETAPSISHKPWFVGMVASNDAKLKVQKSGKDGDFVIRESASTANSYVIVCNVRKTVKEFKILYSNGKYRFSGNADQSNNFQTMDLLLEKVDEARRPAKELCQYLARKPSLRRNGSSSSLTTSPRASVIGGHTGPIRFTPIDLPKDFGLDDEPWFAGPLYETHIDEVLKRGARGSYVVSDTVNGDYLLTVLENKREGVLAHHNIMRQGGAYKLDLNNKHYVTINDVVIDLPKCKSAARKLFEPSYVPKTNTRPRVSSVSSARSTSTAPDDEDFGGFGEEEDQLYVNNEMVPRNQKNNVMPGGHDFPDDEEDQLYMNEDVFPKSSSQTSPKLQPPPLATMLPDGSALPPEESEDLYADEDEVPVLPPSPTSRSPPPPASRTPPPLATMLSNGTALPPEDNEDMYEDVSDDEPPMPPSSSRPPSRTPPPLTTMLPNGTALPPEDNEDMYEDVSDDEPPMPPSSSRPPSRTPPPPLTTMLPNGTALPPEDNEDVYDDGDPIEDEKPLPPPPTTTTPTTPPTQSSTLLPDGTRLPQEESEDMYEDPDDEPPISSSSSPPPPLAPSRTTLPTGQKLPPEDEEEMYVNEEVLLPPPTSSPPPPLAVVTPPSTHTLLPGGEVLPDEEDDELYEYANDEPKAVSPPPTAPLVDDNWSDSDVDLDGEDPYRDPLSEEEDFGGFG